MFLFLYLIHALDQRLIFGSMSEPFAYILFQILNCRCMVGFLLISC